MGHERNAHRCRGLPAMASGLKPATVGLLAVFLIAHFQSATAQEEPLGYGLTPFYGTPLSPGLDLRGIDGKRYRLSDYQGKVLLVNFWATWCPPCIKEMPTLQQVWEQLGGDDFQVLAVNLGESEETIRRFMDLFEPQLQFPILLSDDQSLTEVWRIQALPMSYIVDREGRWAYGELGPRDFAHEHILARIKELIDRDR